MTGADQSRQLARSGLMSFFGAVVSAFMGFVLTFVFARTLGDEGSGIVWQAIAVFTIALSVSRLGMDSAAVWILPRLQLSDAAGLRPAAAFHILVSGSAGVVCGFIVWIVATQFLSSPSQNIRTVAECLKLIAGLIPIASMMLVGLAMTRGLGGIRTYVLVGNVALPTARPVLVGIVAVSGGTLGLVALAWGLPLIPVLVAALVVAWIQIRRAESGLASKPRWVIRPELRKSITFYALPRTLSAILEQALLWIDVVIVGAIAGSAAAGIYSGASRFVAAGLIIDSALRVVVAPRFSELIHLGQLAELSALYRTASKWLVLFSVPIYTMLAVFSTVVLSVLGPSFVAGDTALIILAIGAIITFLAGNIHSVLLMSGHSGWAAFNKVVVLVINVGGNLLLVPIFGLEGAALSWAFSMLLDAVLATIQVKYLVGIQPSLASVLYSLLIGVVSFGAPAIAARLLIGATLEALIISGCVGIVLFGFWCWRSRVRLEITEFRKLSKK